MNFRKWAATQVGIYRYKQQEKLDAQKLIESTRLTQQQIDKREPAKKQGRLTLILHKVFANFD